MVDILKMGTRSLLQTQQALSVTGHNIANVNTEGYSRQTVNYTAAQSQLFGFGYVGQGANIESIDRAYDLFLTNQEHKYSSTKSQHEIFVQLSSRVDDIMANSDNSLNTSIQKFFSAIQDVSTSPSTLPERQVLIGEANNLADRQQNFSNMLADINLEINGQLRAVVKEVNGLADSIALLNEEIASAKASANGALPNDLLDQRDRLIKQLSKNVSVTTIEQDDGALNIFMGKGQALVVGSQSTHIQTQANPYDSSRLEIGIEGQISSTPISKFLTGGRIEGILDFRDRVLIPTQTQLGLISLGLSETVNAQHQLGMDINGELGGQFFSTGLINAAGHKGNTGTTAPITTLTDVGSLKASEYMLNYDGAQWQLTRLSDDTSVTGAGPVISMDGMDIDVSSGSPALNDSFLINPARDAVNSFGLEISDPRKIAAASPLTLNTIATNSGSSEFSALAVTPGHTLPLPSSVDISFDPDALGPGLPGFIVSGGVSTTLAYDPVTESAGKTFSLAPGIDFTISGVPDAGDSYQINNNVNSFGDNSNILNLGELQYKNVLNGSNDTYQEFYGGMVAQIGVVNRQAESNLVVETSLLQQAELYKNSSSGVNLDEEAANMIKFQHNYQAAAQLVKIADELFQTLLGSIR